MFLCLDERLSGLDWPEMDEVYRAVPPAPQPYKPGGVFDCDKFTRWVCAHVNALWAARDPKLPLAHGIINGDLPQDGDDRVEGWHSLCWFLDTKRRLWLFGAQDRRIMNQSALAGIKDVESVIVGG